MVFSAFLVFLGIGFLLLVTVFSSCFFRVLFGFLGFSRYIEVSGLFRKDLIRLFLEFEVYFFILKLVFVYEVGLYISLVFFK